MSQATRFSRLLLARGAGASLRISRRTGQWIARGDTRWQPSRTLRRLYGAAASGRGTGGGASDNTTISTPPLRVERCVGEGNLQVAERYVAHGTTWDLSLIHI